MNLALVLGGYVNGYSIIRELSDSGVDNIWLFGNKMSLSNKSNKICGQTILENSSAALLREILILKNRFNFIIIYPTDDHQLEMLYEIYSEIKDFCFIPFNRKNIIQSLDKNFQYKFCEKLGVPYPQTLKISAVSEVEKLNKITFPILIKPNKREDIKTNVFRSLYLEGLSELKLNRTLIEDFLKQGIVFLASEYIPGNDSNIYAYTGYRSKEGKILNEWTGKKLSQHPDKFGVFSSASNEAPLVIKEQGRKLLEGMDLHGITEPEFKFDPRDGQYKLMEINLRSMMWHRMGNVSGVKLQYTQWKDALGCNVIYDEQCQKERVHLVYMKHELCNLVSRKGYFKIFWNNVFGGNKRFFAIYNRDDLGPFIYDLMFLIRSLISTCLKVLKRRLE